MQHLGDPWNYRRNNDIICHVLFWVLKNPSIVLRHLVTWYECIHTYLIRGVRIYSIRWPHYIYHKLTVHRAYMSGTISRDFLIVYKAHIVMQQRTCECGAYKSNVLWYSYSSFIVEIIVIFTKFLSDRK